MKPLNLTHGASAALIIIAMGLASCKQNTPDENDNLPPVVTTEGDTVHVDTANAPLDTGKTKHPIIKTNSEDGTNSAL